MSQFSMRMDSKLKKETQDNFEKMDLSMSAATGKTELEQSIQDADNGVFGHTYNSAEDFRKHFSE